MLARTPRESRASLTMHRHTGALFFVGGGGREVGPAVMGEECPSSSDLRHIEFFFVLPF